MTTQSLQLDSDGLLWLTTDVETGGGEIKLLGEPRDGIYDEVPPELWPALKRLIDEWEDALRYGRACRATVDEAFRRAQK